MVPMRTRDDTDLDRTFRALAHPIRRSLLESLQEGPKTVVAMAEPHEVSLNAVSKHLKVLEAAGLVARERDGTFHRLSLNASAMTPAYEWLSHYARFWRANLGALKQHLEQA
jgi:DNA-binding transcriptional ArsR family regulator